MQTQNLKKVILSIYWTYIHSMRKLLYEIACRENRVIAKKKNFEPSPMAKKFIKEDRIVIDGFEIVRGDQIKIAGQYGTRFKFHSLVTNTDNGAIWVDCFELFRNSPTSFRSFNLDLVKRIPQRGKRAKRVV